MSAHRTHYALDPARRHTWRSTLAAIAIAAVLAVVTVVASQGGESVGPAVPTPVRTPDVQIYPLEPLDAPRLADLRIEAFRAGYRSALHDGCRLPALATPIAESRP